MRKYGVALGGNSQSRKFGWEVGESGHLYTGEIVEVTVIVDVVADAKRPPPFAAAPRKNLSRDVAWMGLQALPRSRNVLMGVGGLLSAEACDQQQPALLDARRRESRNHTVIHFDCLHQIDVIEMALRAEPGFGGQSEESGTPG